MKLPTYEKILKEISDPNSIYGYNSDKAKILFHSLYQKLTKKQRISFAKKLSLAKWKMPLMIKNAQRSISEAGLIIMGGSGACGLCILGEMSKFYKCERCKKSGFYCTRQKSLEGLRKGIRSVK